MTFQKGDTKYIIYSGNICSDIVLDYNDAEKAINIAASHGRQLSLKPTYYCTEVDAIWSGLGCFNKFISIYDLVGQIFNK